MADDEKKDEEQPKDAGRRALLKAATVAGGAVAASALLPASWKKPVATIGGLPAHAQVSQTITLGDPQAFYEGIPDQAMQAGGPLWASCSYEDALGDFDETHRVTFTVTPGIDNEAAAANGVSDCNTPVTYTLRDLGRYFAYTGGKTKGMLKFAINTNCIPPGSIAWYIHKGPDHVSNLVNASVRYPT